MNESPYFISGKERRKNKKELSLLESSIRDFWRFEQIDRDMGGVCDDVDAQRRYDKMIKRRNRLSFFLGLLSDEI